MFAACGEAERIRITGAGVLTMVMSGLIKPGSTPSSSHDQIPQRVLEQLNSTPSGLTQPEAQARLDAYGPNRLPAPQSKSAVVRFLLQFHNILIYVLLGSAAITAAMNHWVDTLVILAVVIANAVIGFIQEGKAEKAMDAIRHMLAPRAAVVRDGERRGCCNRVDCRFRERF